MAINETGHGINVSNLKVLVDTCIGYGAQYNPTNIQIKIPAMTAKWNAAKAAHETLINAVAQSKIPINQREDLFEYLSKRTTKVLAFVKSLNVSAAYKEDVKGLADKIRGMRVKVKKLPDGTPDPNEVHKSHMSFVRRAESYKILIALLSTEPLYTPNEMAIKLVTLQAEYTAMETLNDSIGGIIRPVNQARIVRNFELYDLETGGLKIASDCKNYVKALYGAGSAEYALVRAIKFRR